MKWIYVIHSLCLISILNGFDYNPYQPYCREENDDKYVRTNCYKVPNTTCEICNLTSTEERVTICNTSFLRVSVADVLTNLSTYHIEVERLIIIYDNVYYGYFTENTSPINLTGLFKLQNLQYFNLQKKYNEYSEFQTIAFDNGSALMLPNLSTLSITVSTKFDDCLSTLMRWLPNLKILRLSNTLGLGACGLKEILNEVQNSRLEVACLDKLQIMDSKLFNANFTFIFPDVVFERLTELDIRNNLIAYLPIFLQKYTPRLKYLDVSGNLITNYIAVFVDAFMHPSIEILNLMDQNQHIVDHMEKNQEQIPELSYSDKKKMNQEETSSILRCVNIVSHGNVSGIFTSNQSLCELMKCLWGYVYEADLCQKLVNLPEPKKIYDPDCLYLMKLPIGKNLRVINISDTHFYTSGPNGLSVLDKICLRKTNNLQSFIMNDNNLLKMTVHLKKMLTNVRGFIGMDNLKNISLRNIGITYNASYHRNHGTLPKLTHVDISGNHINLFQSAKLSELIPNVDTLICQDCKLVNIPYNLFKNCSKLTNVYLDMNHQLNIHSLNMLDLNGTDNLKLLSMTKTGMSILDEEFINTIMKYKNIRIDLSNNPLLCNCSLKAQNFIKWMYHNQRMFINFKSYHCYGHNGLQNISQINIESFWDECKIFSLKELIEILAGILSSIAGIMCMVTVYKLRWRVKSWTFRLKLLIRSIGKKEKHDSKPYKYDAYVSYCSIDRFWVKDTLLDSLEGKHGFRLCIRDRDFLVGGDIATTILEGMNESREVIIVLSDSAILKKWWDFELDHSIILSKKRQKKLTVIKLGKISAHTLNPRVTYLLECQTYLEWSSDNEGQKLFWAQLVDSLYNNPSDFRYEPFKDLEVEYVDVLSVFGHELSPEDEKRWKTALEYKSMAQKSQSYIKQLERVLENDDNVSPWANTPIPGPLVGLLKENRDIIFRQEQKYALDKLRLYIQLLFSSQENYKKLYVQEMKRLRQMERE